MLCLSCCMAFPVVAMIDQLCDLLCLVMSYDAESCQEVRDCSLWLLLVQFFEKEGCKMVDMSCEEHDRQAASTQFITHTVGRVLGAMELQATPIDTRQAPLLRLVLPSFRSRYCSYHQHCRISFMLFLLLLVYSPSLLSRMFIAVTVIRQLTLPSCYNIHNVQHPQCQRSTQ